MRITARPHVVSQIASQLGVSRDELARQMGVASTTAWRIDTEGGQPSPKFIAALIHVSGKPFEDLFEVVVPEKVAV